ncbi:MAG: hypothetical protein JKY23_00305 [Nitrospinaceae bacterium]|nr:hypothetical protein [Nitrospinaceae bacterium]
MPVIVGSATAVDPLGIQPARTYYIKEKLGPMPHSGSHPPDMYTKRKYGRDDEKKLRPTPESNVSRKLLFLDAFTHSPVCTDRHNVSVQNRCRVVNDELVGPSDTQDENLLAFRTVTCQMYRPDMMRGEMQDRVDNRLAFVAATQEAGDSALGPADPSLLRIAANLGYWDAHARYSVSSGNRPVRTPLCSVVGDPYKFHDQLFGGSHAEFADTHPSAHDPDDASESPQSIPLIPTPPAQWDPDGQQAQRPRD